MIYVDNLNKILHDICEEIILDEKVGKLLYYNKVKDKDIYSLDKVKNPMKILFNNKVFKGRRINKIQTESDVGLCVSMSLYEPYTSYYKESETVKTIQYDVIILCHEDCLTILNGVRTVALVDALSNCIHNSKYIKSIGKVKMCQAFPIYDVPDGYEGWDVRFQVNIVNGYK
jgi:hypothetical protein